MKKHRTKTGKTLYPLNLDVMIPQSIGDALKKAAEDQGEKVSVLVRTVLKNWLETERYLERVSRRL
jgi:hypothetical protein